MSMRKLPLRVLYTVNSSPQYILARSPSSVQVTLCPSPSAANAQYGLAPLKACLNAICNSSPELLLDNSRDFSIYVLDPLESQTMPAHVDFSQSNAASTSVPQAAQPRGVAVALGLMSWALTADESDSVTVTGTITTLGTGLDALEVVFALRETKHIQKSHLSDALKSWSQPPKASHTNKSIAPLEPTNSETPPSSQELLTRSADFPEVYIGPPKRGRGRPEGPKKKPKQSKSQKPHAWPAAPPFICAPLVRLQQQEPEVAPTHTPTSLLTILSALSTGRDNTALLAALSTVDSTPSGSEPSPALLNALRDLLAAQSQNQQQSSHALQPVSRNNQDDDIVILEKEHVDPTAFRRRVEREDSSNLVTTTADESETTPLRQRRAYIPLDGKENTHSSPVTRKRRLSDFMAEQENNKARRKRAHARSESGRTSGSSEVPQPIIPPGHHRTIRSDFDTSVSSEMPTSSSLFRPRSSPSRPMCRSVFQSQSSLAMPHSTQAPVKPVKIFVVPEWARTSTATRPKLSKEVEERIALMEQEKKGKRAGRRTQKPGCSQQGARAPIDLPLDDRCTMVHTPVEEVTMPRLQSALSLSLPVFASDVSISSPLSPSSPVLETPPVPSTPPRRTSVLRATSRSLGPDEASPLFSPTPKLFWGSTGKTPHFPSHPRTPSRTGKKPIFSPIRLRTPSAKISPLRLGLRPRSSLEWANKSVEQPVDREEEDLLGKELDDALQGLDVPAVKQQDATDALETGEDNITLPLSPLPPSSPLPPTSPLLLPSTDDPMEDFFDSDAFFSDSDGILGDASEFPPSSNSDWFSSDDDGGADIGELLTLDGTSGLDLEGSFSPNAFADMDFTEFWESLKPLLQARADEEGKTTVSTDSGAIMDGVNADSGKLAQEVQVLFSGCLM
ncbi:uncharacterized protein F5147DRAFT_670513 [Suillus discolor]|uniref:Ams2/SPT21 N-terminal domain-containing protein n=1 Tax=Suillus discolor TaxID=1912936 RepID=A0A9P7JZN2_9AGAM|nr:uncharacterized protein F5147DRAFT_670513 [Suillus discolor]KAG2118218.1 hypothetical protein F5147DRAFT_670513 [Suillus discolor]